MALLGPLKDCKVPARAVFSSGGSLGKGPLLSLEAVSRIHFLSVGIIMACFFKAIKKETKALKLNLLARWNLT